MNSPVTSSDITLLNTLAACANMTADKYSNFLKQKEEKRCKINVSLTFTYCRRPESNRFK